MFSCKSNRSRLGFPSSTRDHLLRRILPPGSFGQIKIRSTCSALSWLQWHFSRRFPTWPQSRRTRIRVNNGKQRKQQGSAAVKVNKEDKSFPPHAQHVDWMAVQENYFVLNLLVDVSHFPCFRYSAQPLGSHFKKKSAV